MCACAGESVQLHLSSKQAEYVREAHHRWNLATGAVRSGKSHMAVTYTIPDRLISMSGRPGLNLILGATKENIERNVLEPMRDRWGDSLVSDINSRNWARIFGQKVYCLGGENRGQVSKLRGSEIKFCYCDEIADISEDVFELLKSRLSLPYSECHAACNPEGPTHFVKRFIDKAADSDGDIDLWHQHYTIYDNPFLPRSYVRSLEAEYRGTVYFDRYITGRWVKAEGLVYPNWGDALEPRWKESPEDRCTDRCVSVDYGTMNAFAAIKWHRDSRGTWHAVDEYRYSGRDEGRQKTDADYGRDLEDFVSDFPEGERVQVIVDPSAASFIAELRRSGRFRVRQADNAVLDGIRDTASCMQRGSVKISEDMVETAAEFGGYVWDSTEGQDRPIKVDDHLMDALRYFVRTKRVYKPTTTGYRSPLE